MAVPGLSFTMLMLLVSANQISVDPEADRALLCPLHRDFSKAVAQRKLDIEGDFEAAFTQKYRAWNFTLKRKDGSVVLSREFKKLTCSELAEAGALVVERYFTDLQFTKTRPVISGPIQVTEDRPGNDAGQGSRDAGTAAFGASATRPKDDPLRDTPAIPVRASRPPLSDFSNEDRDSGADAGTSGPKALEAGDAGRDLPTLPVEATPVLTGEPLPDAGIVDAGSLETVLKSTDSGIDAGTPIEPAAPFAVSLSAAAAFTGWWEVPTTIGPAVTADVNLELQNFWRAGVTGSTGFPTSQAVIINGENRGTLTALTWQAGITGGVCRHFESLHLCGDALVVARVTTASSEGSLYQRTSRTIVMPSAGARGELSYRLWRSLFATAHVTALIPWGQSTLQVEGTEQKYTTPPVDVMGSVGLRFIFF